MNPQNPMEMIAAARAALERRTVSLFWMPVDERVEIRDAGEDVFADVAAFGLVVLSYAEQKAVAKRAVNMDVVEAGYALVAESLRALVIGGPVSKRNDAGEEVPLANPAENPTPPQRIEGSVDAMKYITRMHPIALERLMKAWTILHAAKEKNDKDFLASRTQIAG